MVESNRRRDAGQAALVVVAAAMVVMVVIVGALVQLGEATRAAARAQTAADAAALASIDGGRSAAIDLAAQNGGVVVSWRRGPGAHEVTVVVSVDGVEATARSTNAP